MFCSVGVRVYKNVAMFLFDECHNLFFVFYYLLPGELFFCATSHWCVLGGWKCCQDLPENVFYFKVQFNSV